MFCATSALHTFLCCFCHFFIHYYDVLAVFLVNASIFHIFLCLSNLSIHTEKGFW